MGMSPWKKHNSHKSNGSNLFLQITYIRYRKQNNNVVWNKFSAIKSYFLFLSPAAYDQVKVLG